MFFDRPCCSDVDESMACMREETFGPTLPIVKVASLDEAVRRANDSIRLCAASVFTQGPAQGPCGRAANRLGLGERQQRDDQRVSAAGAFGGRRDSGLGARHGSAKGIRKYCWTKSIIEERFNLPSEIYWYPTKERTFG